MHVHSILSGGSPDIDADVVTVRRMICGDLALRAIEQSLNFRLFRYSHFEVARDVPTRNYQDMATAQTVVVVPNVRERAL